MQSSSPLFNKLKEEQQQLQQKIVLQKPRFKINYIAGCDSAFVGNKIVSVFVIFTYPDLDEVEVA